MQALTRADLVAFQQAWLRPDKAKLFVVSDRPLAEVKTLMEQRLGDWRMGGTGGTKSFPAQPTPVTAKIVLVDRPDSPQSLHQRRRADGAKGTDNLLPADVANDALGGGFLGRLNMDLREEKHWSYGVYGGFGRYANLAPYIVNAPVQADQTGPALTALRTDIAQFLGPKPMTRAEFDRAIAGATRSLSGQFETADDVLTAMQLNDLYRRPDDYYATITQRYRALTLPQATQAGGGNPARSVPVGGRRRCREGEAAAWTAWASPSRSCRSRRWPGPRPPRARQRPSKEQDDGWSGRQIGRGREVAAGRPEADPDRQERRRQLHRHGLGAMGSAIFRARCRAIHCRGSSR
ncbi:M16 family metallopeptidase [Sphingomonas sp. MMS24-JH45]